jgi:anti-anti-sigma factor
MAARSGGRSVVFNVELSVVGRGSHAVVALYGDLELADAPALASHLIAAVAACGPSIVMDLARLDSIDRCGIRVLMRVLKWTRESGGDMSLAAPQQAVRKVMGVRGVIDVFSVYPSVAEAVAALEAATERQGFAAVIALAGAH